MRNPLLILFAVLSFLWLLLSAFLPNRYCNCGAATVAAPVVAPAVEDGPEKSINIADAELGFSSVTQDNLVFPVGNCDYRSPLAKPLTKVFKDAVGHLNANAQRILILTGLSEKDENNTCTDSKNLGLARAEKVKSMLVELGAPADRIRLESEVADMERFKGDLIGGVNYRFISGDIGDVEKRLRMGNITLYFESNEQNLSLNTEQQRYFDDLKFFISQQPKAKILVGGHTDNRGRENWNRRLSRKRAEFVRDYMVENGIPKKNLVAQGFGPSQPIDSNETDEGRAKNRRVEVTIE